MQEQIEASNSLENNESKVWLIKKWVKVALVFFFLASIFGALMRFMFVVELSFLKYKNLLHAHSHTAMLGWGFMLLSAGMIYYGTAPQSTLRYKRIFTLSWISAAGMSVFFFFQGYALFSILFSTLHIFTVYYFAYLFLKEPLKTEVPESKRFFKWSIIWLLVSTIGIWSVGIINVALGKLHPLYFASVQFFLHFQFNGWFTYAMLGLLFLYLHKFYTPVKIPDYVFVILQLSLLLTYTQSITWSTPLDILFHLNALGVVLQLVAYSLILKEIYSAFRSKKNILNSWPDRLIILGLLSLFFKFLIQALVVIPTIAIISYTIRNYVIAYIHLIMLGSITFTVCGILLKENIFNWNMISKTGWLMVLAGFIVTEFILFGQGTLLWMGIGFIPYYYIILFVATLLLPFGIGLILSGSSSQRTEIA